MWIKSAKNFSPSSGGEEGTNSSFEVYSPRQHTSSNPFDLPLEAADDIYVCGRICSIAGGPSPAGLVRAFLF